MLKRMNRHLASVTEILIVVLAVGLMIDVTTQSATLVRQDVVSSKAKEAGEVELAFAAVGSGSTSQIKSRLFTDRITIINDAIREQSLTALPATLHKHRITQSKLLGRVDTVLRQMLQLHGRSGEIGLFLYHDDIPSAMLWRGCLLVLSDGLAEPLYDGELAGVIAHELGHSYFEDEMAAAQRAKDARKMRVIELKCDAVAILSLDLLGHDPTHYLRGLQRIQVIMKRRGLSSSIFQSHPELVVRAQFSQRFIKLLG